MSPIGQRVKGARAAKRWSQRDLEAFAGLSEGHVSLIERGERVRLAGSTMAKLAAALDVDLLWLIDGSVTPAKARARVSGRPVRARAGGQ